EAHHRHRPGRGLPGADRGAGRGRPPLHQGQHHRLLPPNRQQQPPDRRRGREGGDDHGHPAAHVPPPDPDCRPLLARAGAGPPLHARELRGRGWRRRRLRRQRRPLRQTV
ncbi:MAG: protein from nitrogen regulatory protein P-II (GLNB) family, ortholog YAAQ B. subtilis, partial [uncultured Thermomicrobiales bacterium]